MGDARFKDEPASYVDAADFGFAPFEVDASGYRLGSLKLAALVNLW